MVSNIRNSDYYRKRAADIRARGGRESLAATMDNYATLADAGIYDDNTPPVRFGNAQPVKSSSKSTQKVADAPSQFIGGQSSSAPVPTVSESLSKQGYGTRPDDDVPQVTRYVDTNEALPQRGAYMDAPLPATVTPAGNNTSAYPKPISTSYNGDPEGVTYGGGQSTTSDYPWDRQLAEMNNAIDQSINHGGAGGEYGTNRKPTYVSPGAEIWKNARQGYSPTHYPAPVNTVYNGDPEGADYTPDYPWERQLKSMNDSLDRRYGHGGAGGDYGSPNPRSDNGVLPQRGAYMDYPEYELPPMVVTAEAPKSEAESKKGKGEEFQLVGEKPSGSTDLTKYYANQLRYVPYETNEGVNGVKYGSSGLVNRMRDLCQIVPYNETDGTNCARTVSAALDGTPYSGFYNVDQFLEVAAENGQLRDAYSGYKPKAGDLAVTNHGQHVVMVTENGGTIQNGQSKSGVYETNKKPYEQQGGIQFYITTSDYSDLYPSFHFGTGLSPKNLDDR